MKLSTLSHRTLIAGISLLLPLGFAQAAPETYSATVNDGTKQVIHPHAPGDDEAQAIPVPRATTKVAPAKRPAAKSAGSELTVLKRENATLKKRLALLEEAEREEKARRAEEAKQMAESEPTLEGEEEAGEVPVAEVEGDSEAAIAASVAEPAAAKEAPTTAAVVAAPTAQPAPAPAPAARPKAAAAAVAASIDPLDSRMAEKKEARKVYDQEKQVELKKQQAKGFDPVPEKAIPNLALRLKYANEILKRFGRAYDYRVVTLPEFKKILSQLEQSEENQKAKN